MEMLHYWLNAWTQEDVCTNGWNLQKSQVPYLKTNLSGSIVVPVCQYSHVFLCCLVIFMYLVLDLSSRANITLSFRWSRFVVSSSVYCLASFIQGLQLLIMCGYVPFKSLCWCILKVGCVWILHIVYTCHAPSSRQSQLPEVAGICESSSARGHELLHQLSHCLPLHTSTPLQHHRLNMV